MFQHKKESVAPKIRLYHAIYHGRFLLESFEFYPDDTFKWTNQNDIMWSEYGTYKSIDNELTLTFFKISNVPEDMTIKECIPTNAKPSKTTVYEIENDRIYPLTIDGARITKLKNHNTEHQKPYSNKHRNAYTIIRVQ